MGMIGLGPKNVTGTGGYATGTTGVHSKKEYQDDKQLVDLTAVGKEQSVDTENYMSQELQGAIDSLQSDNKPVTLVLSGASGQFETVTLDPADPGAVKFLQDLKAKVDTHQFDLSRLWFRDIGQKAPGYENADGALRQYSLVAEFNPNSQVARPYKVPAAIDTDLSKPNPYAHPSTQTGAPPPVKDTDLSYDRSVLDNGGAAQWPGDTRAVAQKLDERLDQIENSLSKGRKLTPDERLAIACDFVAKQSLSYDQQKQVIQNMFNGCSLTRGGEGWFEGGKKYEFVPIPQPHQGLNSNQRALDSKPNIHGRVDRFSLQDIQTDKFIEQSQKMMARGVLEGLGIPAGPDPRKQVAAEMKKAIDSNDSVRQNQIIQLALRGQNAFKSANPDSAMCTPPTAFNPIDQYALESLLGVKINPDTFEVAK